MARQEDKRFLRQLKREVKRQGTKRVRRRLKQDLRDNPGEAHTSEIHFGRFSSQTLNGLDQDATRRRKYHEE